VYTQTWQNTGTCDGTAEAVFAQAGAEAKARLDQKEKEMELKVCKAVVVWISAKLFCLASPNKYK
jgi:hypothetical protein